MASKCRRTAVAALLLVSLCPEMLLANTIYSYTGGGSVSVGFTVTGSTANLTSGTDVTANIVGGSFSMTYPAPSTDMAGFGLGPGSGVTPQTAKIGTDSGSNIVTWTITGSLFASYPAFTGENPNDFFCAYNVTFTDGGGSGTLQTDNDAGFCPASPPTATVTGTWLTTGATPVTLQSFEVD